MRSNADVPEKTVDDQPDVAALGVEQERGIVKIGSAQSADVAAAHFVGRRPDDEKLFLKKRDDIEVFLGDGERDERQIEAPVVESGHHFLGDANGYADLRIGIAFAQLTKRPA